MQALPAVGTKPVRIMINRDHLYRLARSERATITLRQSEPGRASLASFD